MISWPNGWRPASSSFPQHPPPKGVVEKFSDQSILQPLPIAFSPRPRDPPSLFMTPQRLPWGRQPSLPLQAAPPPSRGSDPWLRPKHRSAAIHREGSRDGRPRMDPPPPSGWVVKKGSDKSIVPPPPIAPPPREVGRQPRTRGPPARCVSPLSVVSHRFF